VRVNDTKRGTPLNGRLTKMKKQYRRKRGAGRATRG
jgi:hypothetical protein